MVVYDGPARLPVPIFNERVSCRLGRGISHSGKLDPEGVELAIKTLTRFCNLALELGIEGLELLGTAAVREAEDGREFTARVEALFGRPVRVLSGAEEARLGALGIVSGLPDADGTVGELGGGSLDLVALRNGEFGSSATTQLGHLRLAEDSNGDIHRADAIIAERLSGLNWLEEMAGHNFFAVGGACRAIARISIDQSGYPLRVLDNYTIDTNDAVELTRVISRLGPDSLAQLDGVARRRADTLPFAALAMCRLLEKIRPSALVFSGYSMREGQLYEMLPESLKRRDPLISACEEFALRGGRFTIHGDETMAWMEPLFANETAHDRRLRQAASLLSDIAWNEHPDYRAVHAFLRVLRFPVAGLSHRDRIVLAIATYIRYNGSRREEEVSAVRRLLTEEDEHISTLIGLSLRLAHVLSGGVPGLLSRTELKHADGRLTLRLTPNQDLFSGDAVERLFRALAETVGVPGDVT
jgi:exopolyphosphatase/guanosine-5'-triphosphate,3'-diphosphate pyrophosphatase